ncbi:MAG: polysaccharide pyruvyl transferase family protein [Candidatus Omnitrophica bacterium]|nr:polysaccharide pyruvyl transferase family protein [Candidatus Omnitrophota bacterium]
MRLKKSFSILKPPLSSAEQIKVVYRNHNILDLDMNSPIRLSWGGRFNNFGDTLSVVITKVLSGRKVIGGNSDNQLPSPKLLGLGTILHRAKNNDIVWGSGVRYDFDLEARELDIHAVRGPLTADYLRSKGLNCPAVYGDPAILMPLIYKPRMNKKYQFGLIAHRYDRSLSSFSLGALAGVKVISVSQPVCKVIDQICQSKIILSSSLHGVIIAESYGIPACWILSQADCFKKDRTPEKFKDYYLSTQRNPQAHCFSGQWDIEQASKLALKSVKPHFNQEELLMSFPFLRPEIESLSDLEKFQIKTITQTGAAQYFCNRLKRKIFP